MPDRNTKIKRKIRAYKRYSMEMEEAGGPLERGDLFEAVIGLEEEILNMYGLPPAHKFRELLREDDIEILLTMLENTREEYRKNAIHDHTMVLVNAIVNRIDDSINVLPQAGLTPHAYQEFMFRRKLLCSNSPAEIDEIIGEMRKAESHLNDLGLLGRDGIKKHPGLYRNLRDAGIDSLDGFLIDSETFDLDEAEMDGQQFLLRADYRSGKGMFDEAVRDYTSAIDLLPDQWMLYYLRGFVFEQKGDRAAALSDYSEAVRLAPNNPAVLDRRGQLRTRCGMYKEAFDDFILAIELEPGSFKLYSNLGNLFAFTGSHEQAVDAFSIAIGIKPDEAFLYCNRGISHYRMGNIEMAKDDLKRSAGMGFEQAKVFIDQYLVDEETVH